MDISILTDYVDRIYKFALSKSFSEDEAEEMSQEILLTALTSLPKLRDESRFEPWLWSVAANTARSFRRYQGRQRAMFVYDAPEEMVDIPVPSDDSEELYSSLRERIAMLSELYRDIIVLHYYDGLSTKQISEKLNIPIGTVTWRLSEARSKLKKECTTMEESALHPIKMHIGIYGSGDYNGKDKPFPGEYLNDALSQNILYNCYEAPMTVEELAKTLGVPAFYIEDRVAYLVDRCALIQTSKGKYRTDFLIRTDKYAKFCEENIETALMPIMDRITDALGQLYTEALKIDHYRAEKTEEELKYLYGAMAFRYLSRNYSKLPYPEIPQNYDGNCWRYIGHKESGKYHFSSVGWQHNSNVGSRGNYEYIVHTMRGFAFRHMMTDNLINVCEDILTKGSTTYENDAALAIKDGYIIRRDNGELFVDTPAFTLEQKRCFDELVERIFAPLMPEYSDIVERFVAEIIKLYPKHLSEDAQRDCQGFFFGFYEAIEEYCVKKGRLSPPEDNWVCDVLIQWK